MVTELTPKASHNSAQGRGACRAPWVTGKNDCRYPAGVAQIAVRFCITPSAKSNLTFESYPQAGSDKCFARMPAASNLFRQQLARDTPMFLYERDLRKPQPPTLP